MKQPRFALLALGAVLLFASCSKKDDNTTPTTPAKPTVIGSWNFVGFTIDTSFGGGLPEVSLWSSITPCGQDNYWTFKEGGAYEQNEGPTKCNSTDPQTIADTWKLDGSKLTIHPGDTSALVMDIARLDADTMTLKFTTTLPRGTGNASTRATYIMKRK